MVQRTHSFRYTLLLAARYATVTLSVPAFILVAVYTWRFLTGSSLSGEDWIAFLSSIATLAIFIWFQGWCINKMENARKGGQ